MSNKTQQNFPGVDLYFPKPDLDLDQIKRNVASFRAHIRLRGDAYPLAQIEKDRFFPVDLDVLEQDEDFLGSWPRFQEELAGSAEFTLQCIGLAMHQCISSDVEPHSKTLPVVRARICNHKPLVPLKDVNVECLGKLVSLRGSVIKVTPVKVVCDYMGFHCSSCGTVETVKQLNGCYTPLTKCSTCSAKGHFEAAYSSSETKTINWQSVVLQEVDCDMAKIPQTLQCELTEDLVKSCQPGDEVTISGVLKVTDPHDCKGTNKQHSVFTPYLEAVAVYNNRSKGSERISFTPEDYQIIKKIHAEPRLFRYLIHSLCPSIYGHEMVKAGLLLGLFKGCKSSTARSESHILIVGDPGLGKSQMLKSCANVSPRGVYVCGNVSTTSGLTVTMTREPGGEYSLEAGALMLADQGCCCIDEFDKMPAQHACLLEAMEQQSISIAKAGVVCSLPTKPTVLVAANPVGGHYNRGKTVAENLKIGSPMLSRFDLIFVLVDRPNEVLDKRLSRHILSAHSAKKRKFNPKDFKEEVSSVGSQESSLRERLQPDGQPIDHLPHQTFRKYIAYAQKYVHPRLSEEAKAVLRDFYVSLRKQFATGEHTPVTARQLHSLIRLTQARAKVELREEASEEDARDVVEIMRTSLIDVFSDEAGCLDTTRSPMGSGMSYKNQVMKLLDVLQRQSEIESKSLFRLQEIREASDTAGIPKNKFASTLQSLNLQGFLLNKGRDTYQLNSAYL